jgi:hypothetical protein
MQGPQAPQQRSRAAQPRVRTLSDGPAPRARRRRRAAGGAAPPPPRAHRIALRYCGAAAAAHTRLVPWDRPWLAGY